MELINNVAASATKHSTATFKTAVGFGGAIKTTVQKAMFQKHRENCLPFIDRDNTVEDLLELINDKIIESGQPNGSYVKIEITKEELTPHLTEDDLRNVDNRGQTALHLAAMYCSKVIISSLLAIGADPSSKDIVGFTPSHYAAAAGNVETLAELPALCHTMADNEGGRMPIHLAAICGRLEIIEYLLACNAQYIDMKDGYGNTPLVLAAMYGHPTVAEALIEHGADGETANRCNITALTVVNQCYSTLGNIMLDKFKEYDEYENSLIVNLEPLLGKDIESENKTYSVYQMLISSENESTSHPVIKELTNKKWELYARKRFMFQLLGLALFNLCWTCIYVWPQTNNARSDVVVNMLNVTVMSLGGLSAVVRLLVNFYILVLKRMFNVHLTRIADKAYNFEKANTHPLTFSHFKHVKNEYKKAIKKRYFASTLLLFVLKSTIDCLWMMFLVPRLFYAFSEQEDENVDGEHIVLFDIGVSILLILVWIQLFNACSISDNVGRFVIFTRHVVKDVAQVFSIYVVFFIPMTAIFWKTVYSHTKSISWFDVPFLVLRMVVVDYDYDLGRTSAASLGLALWWDLVSITWLLLSAMIMLNLFIALMTDRYSSLGATATSICALQRGQFVSTCELIMGPKNVRRFSNTIVQDYAYVTVSMDSHDAQEQIIDEVRNLTHKIEDMSKRLDKIHGNPKSLIKSDSFSRSTSDLAPGHSQNFINNKNPISENNNRSSNNISRDLSFQPVLESDPLESHPTESQPVEFCHIPLRGNSMV